MELSLSQMVLGYFAYYLNPMYFFYGIAFLIRWQYFLIIEDRETMNSILKKLRQEVWSTAMYSVQNRTIIGGSIMGKRCVGYVEVTYEEPKVHIFCSQAFYDYLKELPELVVAPRKSAEATGESGASVSSVSSAAPLPRKTGPTKIEVFVRKGTYKNFYYNKLKLDLSHVTPLGVQGEVVENIIKLYSEMGRATVFIDGVTNAGKSTLGFLLAKELRGAYCHTFNPTQPGDHITTLTMEHMFDEGPLVLVIEEVDELLKQIHAGAVTLSREIPTLVHNKSTWSSFLDDMIFYKKVVLIMTSNTSKQDLDALDPAYLRSGRVHAAFSMPTPLPS
jgi:hypothetical protein